MSKNKIKTKPDLLASSPAHQAAIKDKEATYRAWQFNVEDRFKDKTVEQIRQALRDSCYPFAACMENWTGDFNFSSLCRNANGFNAKEVFYIGDKKIDRRGMQGVQNYTDITWLPSIDDFAKLKERYVLVGIDNVPRATSMFRYCWPRNALMIFGSEGTGLTSTVLDMCRDIVSIPMSGSVRSFNAAVASGISMFDYVSKFDQLARP